MLGWIFGIVGSIGFVGFIALLFIAPAAAQAVEKIALDVLRRILATRIGCAALAGAICGIVGLFYGDNSGAARIQAEWEEAKVEYAESMEALNKSAKAEAALKAAAAAQAERERADSAEQRIADYERTLAAAPAGACSLDDADLNAAGVHAAQPGGGSNRRSIRRNSR